MIFKKTQTLLPKTEKTTSGLVSNFIKEQLITIPSGQGVKMADLVSEILKEFPGHDKRAVYVKINHILRTDANYHRYTNGSRGTSVYIGKGV